MRIVMSKNTAKTKSAGILSFECIIFKTVNQLKIFY